MNWNYKYYTEKELIKPLLTKAIAKKSLTELDPAILQNLLLVLKLQEKICDHLKYKPQINGAYRPWDIGSAHTLALAIDSQWFNDKNYGHKIINYLRDNADKLIKELGLVGFRVFWEWSGVKNFGWIHLDVNFDVKQGECKFRVGYPNKGRDKKKKPMIYRVYEGKAPYEYV